MNLSNALTLSRLILAPLYVVCFFCGTDAPTPLGLVFALIIIIVNLITDYWDGALARRHNMVSDFGKLMDPVTDAVFYITVFSCYLQNGWMPAGLFVVVLARELFMNISLRPYLAGRGIVLAAGGLGKAKTVLQGVVTITLVVFEFVRQVAVPHAAWLEWFDVFFVRCTGLVGFCIVAFFSALSFARYLAGARAALGAPEPA